MAHASLVILQPFLKSILVFWMKKVRLSQHLNINIIDSKTQIRLTKPRYLPNHLLENKQKRSINDRTGRLERPEDEEAGSLVLVPTNCSRICGDTFGDLGMNLL